MVMIGGLVALIAFLFFGAALTVGGDRRAPSPPPGAPGYMGPRQVKPNPPPPPPRKR